VSRTSSGKRAATFLAYTGHPKIATDIVGVSLILVIGNLLAKSTGIGGQHVGRQFLSNAGCEDEISLSATFFVVTDSHVPVRVKKDAGRRVVHIDQVLS